MASRLRMVLPLALVAWMPPAAMVRAGDADARAVALRYLDEMRSAAHAPDREKLRKRMVAELSGTGFEGVQVLAALLREEKADPAPCQLAYALGELGRAYAEPAARLLQDALPMDEFYQDVCVAGGMARLGVAAYPQMLECAANDVLGTAYWCLITLVGQCEAVEGCRASIGVDLLDKLKSEEPAAARIHDLARRWEAWWLEHRGSLRWNPETFVLEERP